MINPQGITLFHILKNMHNISVYVYINMYLYIVQKGSCDTLAENTPRRKGRVINSMPVMRNFPLNGRSELCK